MANAAVEGVLNMDTAMFVGNNTMSIVGIFEKTDAELTTLATCVACEYTEVVWNMTGELMMRSDHLCWTEAVFAAGSFFESGSN